MLNIKNIKKLSVVLLVLAIGVGIGRTIPEQTSIAEVEKVENNNYYNDYSIGYINELKYDKEAEHYYLIILPKGQNDPKKMKIYIPSSMPHHEENSKMLEEYYIDKEVLLTFEHEGGELLEWQVLQP